MQEAPSSESAQCPWERALEGNHLPDAEFRERVVATTTLIYRLWKPLLQGQGSYGPACPKLMKEMQSRGNDLMG